jgi:hypothetical protein
MSHLSRKCPKNGTTGQKSETKWDKKCPGLIENVQGGQVGHRLNVKKCPIGTLSHLNIKGQMSRLRQNICYASLLACGERSARALRADDCHFWIENRQIWHFWRRGLAPPHTQHSTSISRSRALPTATAHVKFFSLQIFSCI